MTINENFFDDLEIKEEDIEGDDIQNPDDGYYYKLTIKYRLSVGSRERRLFVAHVPFGMIYSKLISTCDNLMMMKNARAKCTFSFNGYEKYDCEYSELDDISGMDEYITTAFDIISDKQHTTSEITNIEYVILFNYDNLISLRDYFVDMRQLSKWYSFACHYMSFIDNSHSYPVKLRITADSENTYYESEDKIDSIEISLTKNVFIPYNFYADMYRIITKSVYKYKDSTKIIKQEPIEAFFNKMLIRANKDKAFDGVITESCIDYTVKMSININNVFDERFYDAETLSEYIIDYITNNIRYYDKIQMLRYGYIDMRKIAVHVSYGDNKVDRETVYKSKVINLNDNTDLIRIHFDVYVTEKQNI